MATLLVTRHGQTEANASGVIQGPRIDSELSELGRRQAARLAEALGDVDAVYTSPLKRARQTADAILARRPETPVQVAPEIYEVDYGALIGRTVDDARPELEQVFDAWRMGFPDTAFPGGESAVLAQHRIRPTVETLRGMGEGRVAVVAHGRINRILLATLMGTGLQSLERYPQSNAAMTELHVEAGGVRLVRLNDTGHLQSNEATDSPI